jgi:hypothetical protein
MKEAGMARFLLLLAVLAGCPTSALACRDEPELVLSWLGTADLVVVGHVSNYRIVPDFHDPIAAGHRYELLQRALTATPEQRAEIQRSMRRASDFARIDLQVEEILAGAAPDELEITWDTSWFQLPDNLRPGSYLIALRAPGKAGASPARANSWTVLSPVCQSSFLVPAGSADAAAIRRELSARQGKGRSSKSEAP